MFGARYCTDWVIKRLSWLSDLTQIWLLSDSLIDSNYRCAENQDWPNFYVRFKFVCCISISLYAKVIYLLTELVRVLLKQHSIHAATHLALTVPVMI